MIENFIITYITDYNPYLMEEATAVFNDDGTFNRLRIEEEEYRNLEVKEAQKRAKAHIKEQKGISYKNILTSNTILIDDKTANEYIYSCYTRWSKTDMKYVKCILANYIKELFMNANKKTLLTRKRKNIKLMQNTVSISMELSFLLLIMTKKLLIVVHF